MKIRIHNDKNTDYCDYEAETIKEIKELCAERIKTIGWINGHSELIENE